jgi:hypothetical protein
MAECFCLPKIHISNLIPKVDGVKRQDLLGGGFDHTGRASGVGLVLLVKRSQRATMSVLLSRVTARRYHL